MKDLYLKTNTKAEMDVALMSAGFVRDHESGALYCDGCSLLEIGHMTRLELLDGVETPVVDDTSGWHVNVRTVDIRISDALKDISIYPSTPRHVWAGGFNG